MSWALAADWAVVAGTLLLAIGTGAQARTNLNEYLAAVQFTYGWAWYLFRGAFKLYALLTGRGIQRKDDELVILGPGTRAEWAKVSQVLRLARVWSILALGSVLIFAGAVIQLVLAYTA
jgi:hypothetical protein